MKLIFLDTNVIVDFILERDGAENAANILQLGEDRKIELAVSFLTMANIAYIARKGHTQEQLYSIMSDLSAMFKTLPMDEGQLQQALEQPATDFEDMLQYQCAKANFCDIIITRNKKHFAFSKLPVLTPSEFLKDLQKISLNPYPIPNLGCIKDKETIKIYLKHEENKKQPGMGNHHSYAGHRLADTSTKTYQSEIREQAASCRLEAY